MKGCKSLWALAIQRFHSFQVINAGIKPGKVSSIIHLRLNFIKLRWRLSLPLGSSLLWFKNAEITSSFINVFKCHRHEFLDNSVIYLWLVKLLLLWTKLLMIGRYSSQKWLLLVDWDSLAVLCQCLSFFKETGVVIMSVSPCKYCNTQVWILLKCKRHWTTETMQFFYAL